MLGHHWAYRTLRKYVIAFGTLFNDIEIQRFDNDGNRVQNIQVPIMYAPREKVLARLNQDPTFEAQAITLPRMSFEMINVNYAPERKLQSTSRITSNQTTADDNTNFKYVYAPVPYEINMQLNIYAKYAEDGTAIVEQIAPFFTPEWTFTMKPIDEMEFTTDIPLILQSVISEDTYDGDFEERRAIIWTLDFMLKGYLWGPTYENKKILQAKINKFLDAGMTQNISLTTVTPGLTANGEPTSNAALSIPKEEINETDNYAFITDFEEFFDGTG